MTNESWDSTKSLGLMCLLRKKKAWRLRGGIPINLSSFFPNTFTSHKEDAPIIYLLLLLLCLCYGKAENPIEGEFTGGGASTSCLFYLSLFLSSFFSLPPLMRFRFLPSYFLIIFL